MKVLIKLPMPTTVPATRHQPVDPEDLIEHWESCSQDGDLSDKELCEAQCLLRCLKQKKKRETTDNLILRLESLLMDEGITV